MPDYIARMDAGDLMHPDRLRLQMPAFRANPRFDIVSADMAIVNMDYQTVDIRLAVNWKLDFISQLIASYYLG